ncbi:SOS response-associated peptidase family protein [Scandinavium goeteborgense]|uniref:Abasic site processing protein n=1 Tax=Scandinavium goeteborgense TaxID=1851514 RepID=A0A4R6E1C6_SCAGO|nr:SOS response-associated peptidase family protein [Scandinavium goeteborgense]TDN51517.1 putative SOS response-associated peptidase YedK [Scandinavium goeteborgense]
MCGRFSQYNTREDYLAYLAETDRDIPFDPQPIGRYNVAPGTKVLLLNERNDLLHLDSVIWGYAPSWWHKPPLINARVETAASSRMFKPLWQRGRAIVFADGWYEWVMEGEKKQPYYIYREDGQPLFLAVIGKAPFEQSDGQEGFVIITSAAEKGLLDIHDRRPLALTAEAAKRWLQQDISAQEAEDIARNESLPADAFAWHAVSKDVGNAKNQGRELIKPINPAL